MPADGKIGHLCQRGVKLEQFHLGYRCRFPTHRAIAAKKHPAAQAVTDSKIMCYKKDRLQTGRNLGEGQGGNINGVIPRGVLRGRVQPAAEIVREIVAEADAVLARLAGT